MKYLDIVSGRSQQKTAITSTTGAPDANKIVATGADGRLDTSLMPVGIGADVAMVVTSEALSSGDFVNIWNDAGTPKVRKADATTAGKEAVGFVIDAFLSGATATVYFEGRNTGLTGLTTGTRYYLSTTPGTATAVPPSATGNVVQYIGSAYSTTEIAFEATDGIILA